MADPANVLATVKPEWVHKENFLQGSSKIMSFGVEMCVDGHRTALGYLPDGSIHIFRQLPHDPFTTSFSLNRYLTFQDFDPAELTRIQATLTLEFAGEYEE